MHRLTTPDTLADATAIVALLKTLSPEARLLIVAGLGGVTFAARAEARRHLDAAVRGMARAVEEVEAVEGLLERG